MKRIFNPVYALVLILLLQAPATCPLAGETKKTALAFVKKPQINAGTVVEGFVIRHTFLLQNRGEAPLVIHKAKTDCSCTKLAYDKTILPRHNTRIRVVFNTAGQAGDQVKTIRLHSNDPLAPVLELTVRAKVLPAISVTPDRIFFNGPQDHEYNQTVTITAPDNKPFELKLKESHLSKQTGFRIEKQESGNTYRVMFRHRGEHPEISRGRLFLTTDIPYRPLITIPVYARIQPPLSVVPKVLNFGRQKLSLYRKTRTPDPVRSVNLKFSNHSTPKINSLDIDPDRFETQIRYLPDIGIARIRVRARIRKFESQPFKTQLIVRLENTDTRELVIPVIVEPF